MIRNPIIHKEVLTALRTKRALAMQAAFFLAVLGLLWLLWPEGGLQDIGGEQARRILSVLALGELILVILLAPAFTAAAITSEKEHNTLEGLFASRLRPWEIAFGKIAGALSFVVLVVLTGIPALAAPFLLGGVGGGEVLAIVGILLLTAVYLGLLGLLASTIFHRSYRAIIAAYVILLGVCFVLAAPAWPISRHLLFRGGTVWQTVFHLLASLSPVEAMLSRVWPDSLYSRGALHMPPFWVTYLFASVVMIILTSLLLLVRLRRPPQPPRPREKLRVIERGQVTARNLFFIFDPRKRKPDIAWWKNPVLSKEFRTRPMLQTQWLLRAVGICLIVSVLLMFLVNISVMAFVGEQSGLYVNMASAVAAMMVVLVVVLGPAVSGGSICADRETGVWDLLRVTPIPSWRIVSGKFQASIIPLVLLVLAGLPALFILIVFDNSLAPHLGAWLSWLGEQGKLLPWLAAVPGLFLAMIVLGLILRNGRLLAVSGQLLAVTLGGLLLAAYVALIASSPMLQRVCGVTAMTILFVCTAGTMFSSLFSRTSTATAWTYALVVALALLSLLVLLAEDLFSRRFVEAVFLLNPIVAAMEAAGAPAMREFSLLDAHMKIMAVATAGMFAVTVVRVIQLRRAS